jgi:small subunit ribosomal protein S7
MAKGSLDIVWKVLILLTARPSLVGGDSYTLKPECMPRKRITEGREVVPDPIYNSPLVTKFIHSDMWGSKKSVAEGIFYNAMKQIGEKTGEEPLKVFRRAIDNVKPTIEFKSRRVGGTTVQEPSEVRPERRGALAIRWIVSYARGRSERTMTDRLAEEILDAANNRGNSVKKKEDTERMAVAYRARFEQPSSKGQHEVGGDSRISSTEHIGSSAINESGVIPSQLPGIQVDGSDDPEVQEQIEMYFDEIAISIKRSHKIKTEIDSLNQKTQVIIDTLS